MLIPNALGDYLTPSAVHLDEAGNFHVGMAARERMGAHPGRTATSFKRLMGTQEKVRLGRQSFLPEELSALVLRSLKADAEAFLGEEVTGAVITVPAYFNDRQRKATRRAGALAGLTVSRLLNEPTAAALAYGLQDKSDNEPFLVFDLGGGTFDVSIVEMFDGIIEVRASSGDSRLGGDDFNRCLIDLVRPRLSGEALDWADPMTREARLVAAAERARRELSEKDSTVFALTLGEHRLEAEVTAEEFEAHAQGLLARLRDPVLRSLRDSNIRIDTLSDIVLVGGGTRMPVVRRAITRMFGRFPNSNVHPDLAVGLGAAVQAGLLARDAALDEIRLTDVCPFTLGVEAMERDARGQLRGGLFSPIIERNTPIPASRVETYRTVSNQQRELKFDIYQGEAREVKGNVLLGSLRVPVPPLPAGHASAECRFSYDTSGLLEVDVYVPGNDMSHNLVLLEGADELPEEEMTRRREVLAALKKHPREDAHNQAVLARAERCFESFIGENRDMIGRWILAFEGALGSQDKRVIEPARAELIAQLDALEGERYL